MMENFKSAIQIPLHNISSETLDLLRRNNLIHQLVRQLLEEEITKKIALRENQIQELIKKHCQQKQIQDNSALNNWLKENCISREELIHQLKKPLQLAHVALDFFGVQAENHFLERKDELDQVIYCLLRVKDSGKAYELYLQLEANESSFESLATDHSEGPEQHSRGKVGPGSLQRAHPRLQQLLRTATPGVVQEPILIEQWWVVARLEERREARFDHVMRQRMASELLQDWLTNETKTEVKSLFSADDVISMP